MTTQPFSREDTLARKGSSGFGLAALILGIVAVLLAWIPCLGLAAFPIGIVGLLLGITGVIVSTTSGQSRIGMSIAGSLLCLVALGIAMAVTVSMGGDLARQSEEARRTRQQSVASLKSPASRPLDSRTATQMRAEDDGNKRLQQEPMAVQPDAAPETTPPASPEIEWEEVGFHKPTVYATVLIKTSAQHESDFRSIISAYRSRKLRGDNAFQIYFIPLDAPKLAALADILEGRAGDEWQDHLIASYSYHATSGLDELEVYRDAPTPLLIEGTTATQLYASGNTSINDRTFLVRVDSLDQATLQRVADHYEKAFPDTAYLYVYFVTSDRKWRAYPRVWPSELPEEIHMVYEHVQGKPARFVKGSEFR